MHVAGVIVFTVRSPLLLFGSSCVSGHVDLFLRVAIGGWKARNPLSSPRDPSCSVGSRNTAKHDAAEMATLSSKPRAPGAF
jgi:hypothetical protein